MKLTLTVFRWQIEVKCKFGAKRFHKWGDWTPALYGLVFKRSCEHCYTMESVTAKDMRYMEIAKDKTPRLPPMARERPEE